MRRVANLRPTSRIRIAFVIAALPAALAAAQRSHASIVVGKPITVRERAAVRVQFASQSAGATGSLYFMGIEREGVVSRAASSDEADLGEHLFSNHGASPELSVDLGVIDADATLHFAYLITRGVRVAPTGSLFRTDVRPDLQHFAQQAVPTDEPGVSITRVGVEDIRDAKRSDFDYNDIRFDVIARSEPSTSIPAPASAAALLIISAAGLARRRRQQSTE